MRKFGILISLVLCCIFCFCACKGVEMKYEFYQVSYLDSNNIEHFYSKSNIDTLTYNQNLPESATQQEKAENFIAMLKEHINVYYEFYNDNTMKSFNAKDQSEISTQKWKEENGGYTIYNDEDYSIIWQKSDDMLISQSEVSEGLIIRIYIKLKK